jgi:23S rRNA (uracil1939-C5)-methyltransferase
MGDRLRSFDAIVANPPRRGISPAAREWIGRAGAEVLAYVSCDPQTLARDVDHLGRLGFGARALYTLDMIPLTDEVETVALLHRAPVPPPRVLHESDEIVIVDKPPHEPTTPQGEYASSLMARLRSVAGMQGCVPLNRLEVGTSGAVVLARRAELVSKWTRALEGPESRVSYVVAVRGVTAAKGSVARALRTGNTVLHGRTRYRRLAVASGQSVLRVVVQGGQGLTMRRHLASIGHPILGDDRFGHAPTNRHCEERHGLDRTFIHCSRVQLTDPDSGARHAVDAPLAADLRMVLERMGAPKASGGA